MRKAAKKKTEGQVESFGQRVLPLAALAFTLRRGLRELVVEAGMQTLDVLLEEERTQLCGKRYHHKSERRATRAGHAPGELVMGGRKVRVSRPRARTAEGARNWSCRAGACSRCKIRWSKRRTRRWSSE